MEAMPRVVVTEEDTDCAICLEDYEVGGEAREMLCKHKFHSGCIEKWLGIHGFCPISRFSMPVAGGDGDGGDKSEITESREEGVLSRGHDLMDVTSDSDRGSEDPDPTSDSQDGIVPAMDDTSTNEESMDTEC